MSKKVKIILLTISLALTLIFVFGLTGAMYEYDRTKHDFIKCVYLHSSETVFSDDTITVKLKNISDKDFEDVTLHLMYVNKDNKPQGFSYSEQKIVTLKGEKTTTLTFANPGWIKNEYNQIKVAKFEEDRDTWTLLKTGSDFVNSFEDIKTVTIFASVGIFTFLVVDTLMTIWLVKDKSLVVAKAKEEETK